ncbi:dihydropyrimidinase [Mediterraneibacter agrestimuris]|uniref:dihydropyrimidinase n=1 Tax=Mediterraneibacter agrestimuris TaxID=2941333 RepID=UPI0020412F9F|nr:dihydropyrimidinase [Mediterraneibacter agrestimuris]
MKTIIKNGTVVTSGGSFPADILIDGEKIVSIGTIQKELDGDGEDVQVIDAAGKYVFPGAVDVHTHMDLDVGISRAVDDFYDGTVAAVCGGTTSIVDHMAFGSAGIPLHYMFREYEKLAGGKAVIDYGFHGTMQHLDDEILAELETMMADGIPSVKLYMTYNYKMNDAEILQTLRKMKAIHGITAFHCENHDVTEFLKKENREKGNLAPIYHAKSRPNAVEAEAVERVLRLAKMAGNAPVYIVHLSCKESLEAVRRARSAGQKNIFVETCPQYLTLTEERYLDEDGLKYIMSPPLRTQEDCDALWEGIDDGSIQVVATDHCPFNYSKEKQMGKDDFTCCPNGAPGVEERFSILFSEGVKKGRITLQRLVEVACANPCRIYGLAPEKGDIQPGADADIVILDPDASYILSHDRMHGAVDYTMYEGKEIQGEIELVMQRGNVLVKDDQFVGEKGQGRFIHRKPYAAY